MTSAPAPAASAERGPDTERSSRRRRMALALTAGGLVLGVGAAVTLAVWNDSEFVTGTFGSGTFDLQGSTDGAAFSSSPAAPGKTVTFELDADTLAPGDVVYAPFAVQLSDTSTNEASVTIENVIGGAIGDDLAYSLFVEDAFGATCSAATPPVGDEVVADRAANATGTVDVFDLTAAGEPVNLCFVVTAGAIAQGEVGTITWEFAATSGATLA
ncbi:SipW-dependent-type signal peptide-containing protein [Microbacterium sp. cf332]|uniref:SipW-dependent-type signal peptide-containing protein n=1 Tax=Microbacterium sp. cf332 TaxID=1761804 RepID=UPI000890233E|nr:SipW-dependent-type signal peptide-containing protein [Microbacterium sp. cf332]SDQ63937.1 SipW-cognate class signal peptide [Microbacterium sp. cf332]